MRKKWLIFILSSMIVVLAASTTITVAWYATSDFLRIEDFNISFKGSGDLLLATEDKEEAYKNHLEYSDLKKVDFFEPVTSMMESNWMSLHQDHPTFYKPYNRMLNTLNKENACIYAEPMELSAFEGYYSQDIYLKSGSNVHAVIDTEHTVFKPNFEANYKKAQEMKEKGKSEKSVDEIYADLNNLINSIRFSVLVLKDDYYDYKVIDPLKNETTYYGGVQDTSNSGYYDTLIDDENLIDKYEVLYGEVNDRSLISYYEDPSDIPDIVGPHSWYNAEHDKEAYVIDMETSKARGLEVRKEPALSLVEYEEIKQKILNYSATEEEMDAFLHIPLVPGTPTKIVLSIFFEGWDHDSLNDTMGASFTCNIAFGVVNELVF